MTMTDNDDPPSRRARAAVRSLGKVAPTEPEVPRAKRRGELRRKRSAVGLYVVVTGLLSITLALLYRAGQLGVHEQDDKGATLVDGTRADTVVSPLDVVHESTLTRLGPPPAVQSGSNVGDDVSTDDQASTDSAPAESASPHPPGPPPAIDIIRTPAF